MLSEQETDVARDFTNEFLLFLYFHGKTYRKF